MPRDVILRWRRYWKAVCAYPDYFTPSQKMIVLRFIKQHGEG